MWQIFHTESQNQANIISSVDKMKKDIFEIEAIKVKEYFAKKVSLNFDNLMIFFATNGLETNLVKALADSQDEMKSAQPLFPTLRIYLVKEDSGFSLMIKNAEYSEYLDGILSSYGFTYIGQEDGNVEHLRELEFNSWSTLVFDLSLVNYARSWINYIPAMEDRAIQQAEHILFIMTFKKVDSTMLERINFLKEVKTHPKYKELYEKIIRLMPKLERSLEKQWRISEAGIEGGSFKIT